jgi:hypothetical protein
MMDTVAKKGDGNDTEGAGLTNAQESGGCDVLRLGVGSRRGKQWLRLKD